MPEQVGRRISFPAEGGHPPFAEGDYGKDPESGWWFVRPPGSHLGSLREHDVTEHDDGTITVSPSILQITTDERGQPVEEFHGWLRHGVWTW